MLVHIVDDDEAVARTVARLVRQEGWESCAHASADAFLRADGIERPCRIHNLSNAGAMIESDPALSVGSTVEIALSSRHRVAAIVKWQRDGLAGLEYPDRLDCFSVIREIAEDHWSGRLAPTG